MTGISVLTSNPCGDNESDFTGVGRYIHVFYNGNDSTNAILSSAEELWNARTKYVGDNSAVGKSSAFCSFLKRLSGFELHTSGHPRHPML